MENWIVAWIEESKHQFNIYTLKSNIYNHSGMPQTFIKEVHIQFAYQKEMNPLHIKASFQELYKRHL